MKISPPNLDKWRQRSIPVAVNALRTLLPQAASLLLSLLVVRLFTQELWGQVVNVMVWVHIAVNFLNWGQRDFLLKAFSKQPAQAGMFWRQIFTTRLLLFPIVALGFLLFTPDRMLAVLLLLWVLIRYAWFSYDVWIVYLRHFNLALLLEVVALSGVLAGIFWTDELSLKLLITYLVIGDLSKVAVLGIWFRKEVSTTQAFKITPTYFQQALPFFLISFSGLLQSRVDMLCVNVLLPASDKALYQVFINLLLVIIAIPALVITPFLKNFYRSADSALKQSRIHIALAGLVIVPIAVFCIYWVLEHLYGFSLHTSYGILASLYVWPVFYYSSIIFTLFKTDQQNLVVLVTFICIVVNLVVALWLIPTQGITGALTAAAAGQWCMLMCYGGISLRKYESYA